MNKFYVPVRGAKLEIVYTGLGTMTYLMFGEEIVGQLVPTGGNSHPQMLQKISEFDHCTKGESSDIPD